MKKILLISVLIISVTQSLFAKDEQLEDSKEPTRFESLSKLTKVIGTVEKYYVDDIELQEVVDKALKGLMKELDAHSSFLDKSSSKEMQVQTKGEFGGLGITVGMRDGALTVISPIDNTPAYKAGIKASDIILKIDEKATLNMTLEEAVSLMRGKPKTDIVLTIVREGERKPLKIKITRDIIEIQSVFSKTIEDENLLYIRVTSFDEKAVDGIKEAINKNKKVDGIILDLRNNPGGLLSQAIGVSDIFIKEGIIVSQKGRDEQNEEIFEAKKSNTISNHPLVTLVNGGSASASEIVSGALQDHKRSVVVGEQTFGKGSVQAVLPITSDRSENIKLTIAKYYLPNGRTIQAKGISPDIIAHAGDVTAEKNADLKIKEADLKKHLEGELQKEEKKKKITKDQEDIVTKEQIVSDNQLNTAIGILKSLIIMK
ncbi:MAG: S41 family peptidase [Campylobacterota bacterium]